MLTQEGLLNKESNQDKKGKKTGLTVGELLKKKDQDGSAVSEEPVEQLGESTEESSIPVVENLKAALEKPIEQPNAPIVGPEPEQPISTPEFIEPDFIKKKKALEEQKSNLDKKRTELESIPEKALINSPVRIKEYNQMISNYESLVDNYNKEVQLYNESIQGFTEELIPEKPEEARLKVHPDNTVGQNQLAVLKSQLDQNKQLSAEDKRKQEQVLSELDNGISRGVHVLSTFDKTVVSGLASITKAIAIVAKKLNDDVVNLGGPDSGQPIEEYLTYKWGEGMQKWAEDMFPTNPKYQREFLTTTLPSGAASMVTMMLGGAGRKIVTQSLLKEAEKNVYKSTMKQITNTMGAGSFLVGGTMMGVPEYENAKKAGVNDEEAFQVFLTNYAIGQTDALPIGITLNRLNKLTSGGVVKVLNEGFKGGTREMIQEVGQNYLTNLTAQNYYDEFRKLYQGMAEEGAAGFILGGLLGSAGAISITKNLPKAEKDKLDSFISEEQEKLKENVGDFGPIPPVGPIPPAGPATVVQTIDQNLKQAETTDANQLDKLATQVQQQVDKTQGEKPIVEETKVETGINVGQTEIKSETEQDPVQQEAPIVTVGNENYSVTNKGGALTVKDAQGNEIPSQNVIKSGKNKGKRVPNPKYQQAVKQYADQYDFTKGESINQFPDDVRDVDSFIAGESSNPAEIAQQYHNSRSASEQDYKTQIMDDHLPNIKRQSFVDNADENLITMGMAKSYFSKDGSSLDNIAEDLTEIAGIEITEQDVVDYIVNNPNRVRGKISETQGQKQLKDKFEELTGLPLNTENVQRSLDQLFEKQKIDSEEMLNQVYYDRNEAETSYQEQLLILWQQYVKETAKSESEATGPGIGDTESKSPKTATIAPPPTPTGAKETSKKTPKKKKRRFAQQILNDPNIRKEVKEGLSEDAVNYVPLGNELTNKEANAIIDAKINEIGEENGLENVSRMVKDFGNSMNNVVRSMMAQILIKRFDSSGSYNKAIDTVDWYAPWLTEIGQIAQSASVLTLLSPEGQIIYAKKQKSNVQKAEEKRSQPARDKIIEIASKANKANIEKVLSDKEFKKHIKTKIKGKSIDKAIGFLESLKIETKGKALDVGYGLTAGLWNSAITTIQKSLKAGYTISQAINRAIKKIKNSGKAKNFNAEDFSRDINDRLKDYKVVLDPEKAIKEGLTDFNTTTEEIIRKHYTETSEIKKDLVDKLVNEANLSQEDAQILAKKIAKKFNELTGKAKKKAINKILPKPRLNKKRKNKVNQLADQIIEASNLGILDNKRLRIFFAEKLGTPNLTEVEAKKLTDITKKIQSAKARFEQSRYRQDLLDVYHDIIPKEGWIEVAQALRYFNMLSGPSTQYLNIVDTFFNVVSNQFIRATINYDKPKFYLYFFSKMFQGMGKPGFTQAMETLRTGYDPIKGIGIKVETLPIFERLARKSDKWNIYDILKLVRRFMVATDIFNFHGEKLAAAYELALIHGKKENGYFNKKYADKLLGMTEENRSDAYNQAIQEGYKGREATLRAFEIIEDTWPEYIIEESNIAAAIATYNYPAKGLLGQTANWIATGAEKINIKGFKPLKIPFPFTNVIANVFNEKLNYFPPIAAYRLAKGGIGYESQGERFYQKYNDLQKGKVLIKGMMGIMAMGMFYRIFFDNDDEDNWIKITANGYGDYKRNYELRETGWRPYTISFGKWQFDYRVTPLAIPFAVMGYISDARKYQGEEDLETKLSIILFGTVNFMSNMIFLRGANDFFKVFSEDNPGSGSTFWENTTRYFRNVTKSFVGPPNAVTQISRSIQEVQNMPMKKSKNLLQDMTRDLPYIRDGLDNMYNVLGEPVIPDMTSRFLLFTPKKGVRDEKSQKIWQLIIDNNALIGVPARYTLKPDGKPMTQEEYDKFALKSGQLTKEGLSKYLYRLSKMKDKEDVKEIINCIKKDARKQARMAIFGYKGFQLNLSGSVGSKCFYTFN